MKIAVTGASGFVGSHVLDALGARSDVEVVATSRSPIAPERLPANARHVALDLGTCGATAYAALGSPDVLIHLAWGGLPNYLSLHHFETELPAQYRFLHDMIDAGLPALVATGTCYEYGMTSGSLTEDGGALAGNPYAYAKCALLDQLKFLKVKKPFELTWARLFYMYGERQAPTSIYPLLKTAVANGEPTFPMSRGEQLRDYLPIAKVARHLIDLALLGHGVGAVNICSGEPISIRALVEGWIAVNGWQIVPDLGRYPYPSYEPLAFWGNRSKLDAVLKAG